MFIFFAADKSFPTVDVCPISVVGSVIVVTFVAVIVVVIVILVFLQHLKSKWSREKVERFMKDFREKRETENATNGSKQKEEILNLLREILKGGRINKSLKAEMLSIITDEVGNEVTDWKSQSTHLESTSFISGQQPSTEAKEEAGGKGNYSG